MLNALIRKNLGPDGYRLFPQVVPMENVREAVRAICDFTAVWPEDPASWLGLPPENEGVVPLHHAPAFWRNRTHPSVYAAFRRIYETEKLWVTMDRAFFRPPSGFTRRLDVGNIRWEVDPAGAHPGSVRGMLLLSDSPAEAGGFQCIPQIYRRLDSWLREFPKTNWESPNLSGYEVTHVAGKAGDLLVWDPFLPNGMTVNISNHPRISQNLSMVPVSVHADPEFERRNRVRLFTDRRPPEKWRGLTGQQDPEPLFPIELTELGRRLVGLEPWEKNLW